MGFNPYDNSIYFKIQQQKIETNNKFQESVCWDWTIDKGNKDSLIHMESNSCNLDW